MKVRVRKLLDKLSVLRGNIPDKGSFYIRDVYHGQREAM